MPWFTKKERRRQVSAFPAIFKADFGCFRYVSAVFRPVSAVLAAGRYDSIRPNFGWISPVRHESKPIRCESSHIGESSRIGVNRAESARIQEKKKKKNADMDWHADNHVWRGCGTSGAASMLPSCSDQYLSPNKDFSDLDLLQFFRLQGSDRHGNHIFCVVGKYFPGKQTWLRPLSLVASLRFVFLLSGFV